jgi:hypothetical protein
MVENTSDKKRTMFLILGWILIIVGMASNEWVIAHILSSDGVLEISTRVKIWLSNIFIITSGYIIIRYRKKVTNFKNLCVHIIHSYPNIVAIFIGLLFIVVTISCIEMVFYALNNIKQKNIVKIEGDYRKGYFQKDNILGYKPKPSSRASSIKKWNDEILYNIIYSTDEYSRRITPIQDSKDRNNFILFFGGSFTFGEGVNDNETLPFYVSQFSSRYNPYNYGFAGYGPQSMLAKLQSMDVGKEIRETYGILIYTFIDHHINRAIGDMHVFNKWGENMPYYTIDTNNNLIKYGNFTSGRPVLSRFYRLMTKSYIMKYFNVNFPLRINDYHIKITSKIIEESRNTFRKKFHSDDFYVIIYPDEKIYKKIIPYFIESKIKYLDYSNLIDFSEREFHIKHDGHPTAKAYLTIAEKLTKDIGIYDKRP